MDGGGGQLTSVETRLSSGRRGRAERRSLLPIYCSALSYDIRYNGVRVLSWTGGWVVMCVVVVVVAERCCSVCCCVDWTRDDLRASLALLPQSPPDTAWDELVESHCFNWCCCCRFACLLNARWWDRFVRRQVTPAVDNRRCFQALCCIEAYCGRAA